MESTNTPKLVMICQKGISDTPNLSIAITGAVTGNIVSPTHTGLLGKKMSNDDNQRGEKPNMM